MADAQPAGGTQDAEDTDGSLAEKAEQTKAEAALEAVLDSTFPTSDPSSSWAGPDAEPQRPIGESNAQRNRDEDPPA